MVKKRSEVKWSFPDRMGGCFWERLKFEFDSRPPSHRKPPFPRNGDNDDSMLEVLIGLFSWI